MTAIKVFASCKDFFFGMAFPNILNLYPLYDMNICISVAYFVTMQVDFPSSYPRQIFVRKNNRVF